MSAAFWHSEFEQVEICLVDFCPSRRLRRTQNMRFVSKLQCNVQFINCSVAIDNVKCHRNALLFTCGFVLVNGVNIKTILCSTGNLNISSST